tara:strand:- start:4339 stop:4920 length:582 start_codon:yes stop_codon:yes gene_type:complete
MNYDNKSKIMQRAFDLMRDGIKNRSSMFHTLTMSTLHNKIIDSRVMVLRDFNAKRRFLRFHSDFRSKKVKAISDNPTTSVIGYDPEKKTQIRMIGISEINHNNEFSRNAWEESQAISKKCYLVKDGSSYETNKPDNYDFHIKDVDLEEGYKNFSTIVFTFSSLEFLYLQRSGHRRCKFEWDLDGNMKSYWLVP